MSRIVHIERHRLGPRLFLAGRRVHEWHAGALLLLIATASAVGGHPMGAAGTAAIGLYLVAKDWPDLTRSGRDRSEWAVGLHRPPRPLAPALRREWVAPLAGRLTSAVGAVNVATALALELPPAARDVLALPPVHLVPVVHAVALPAGALLLVLGRYLAGRRRRAMWVGVATLGLLGVADLVDGFEPAEAVLSLGLAALLVWGRASFTAPGIRTAQPPGMLLAALGAAAAGVIALVGAPGMAPTDVAGVSMVLALAAVVLLQPLPVLSTARRHAAIRLVRAHGNDTLSGFKLRSDLHHLVGEGHDAVVSYREHLGVMLMAGDPVAATPLARDRVLTQAAEHAARRGLRLAAVGVGDEVAARAEALGLRSLYIGDEAVVRIEDFSLEGRPIRKVRQSVTRLARRGYRTEVVRHDRLTSADLDELDRVSRLWRRGAPERGFSMALDDLRGPSLSDSHVLIARDEAGAVRGFLHFLPTSDGRAASLTFMRRDPETPNGLTEFMVVAAIEAFRDLGVAELSLNFAAFGRWLRAPANRREALLARLVPATDRWFQIESLYRFNAKFFPEWRARHLLYAGPASLPVTAFAALSAEGQLPLPHLPRLFPPRAPLPRPAT